MIFGIFLKIFKCRKRRIFTFWANISFKKSFRISQNSKFCIIYEIIERIHCRISRVNHFDTSYNRIFISSIIWIPSFFLFSDNIEDFIIDTDTKTLSESRNIRNRLPSTKIFAIIESSRRVVTIFMWGNKIRVPFLRY